MSEEATFYADPRHLRGWFEAAGYGDRAVYATGPALDADAEVVRQVNLWAKAKEVALNVSRINGRCAYLVTRREPPAAVIAAKEADYAGRVEERMLALLQTAAERTLPCPSYAEMADALNMRDRQAARYAFMRLVKIGLIRVNEAGARRVVTIVKSGASTAAVAA